MDAVSLPVFTRVSSQMAPVRILNHRCQGSMGSYIRMPAFGTRFLAGICQAPFHCPVDGGSSAFMEAVYERGISRISSQQVSHWQIEAGEGGWGEVTSIQGLEQLLVFLSGASHEIRRENLANSILFNAYRTGRLFWAYFVFLLCQFAPT